MQLLGLLNITEIYNLTKILCTKQARSQKFAVGGGANFGGLGRSPQPSEANGGLGTKPGLAVETQRSKSLHFLQK